MKHLKKFLTFSVIVFLTACGGGGSSGSENLPGAIDNSAVAEGECIFPCTLSFPVAFPEIKSPGKKLFTNSISAFSRSIRKSTVLDAKFPCPSKVR